MCVIAFFKSMKRWRMNKESKIIRALWNKGALLMWLWVWMIEIIEWKGVIGITEVVNISDYKLKSSYNRERLLKIYSESVKYGLIALPEKDWLALVKRDIIKPDTMLSQITMLKKEAVLKVHRYKSVLLQMDV